MAESAKSSGPGDHKVIVQAIICKFRQRWTKCLWNANLNFIHRGLGIRSLAPFLTCSHLGDCVLISVEEVELRLVCTFVVTFMTAIARWFILVALKRLLVCSANTLSEEKLTTHLDFQLATPPTAFAWASIVRHCDRLVLFERVNYHTDDFEQTRV